MSKRWSLSLVALAIVSLAQLKLPLMTAQSSLGDDSSSSCSSGIYSSVDGSCVGDQSQQPGQVNNLDNSGGFGSGGLGAAAAAASGLGSSSQGLLQQYPGLLSQGMNGKVPSFFDRSGLAFTGAQQEAQYEAWELARQARTPPTEFQQMVQASTGKLLPVYGDTLFREVPSTFAPLNQIPAPENYVVGPGDQLVVRIWGQVNFNAQLTVDRSGSIYLPHVGEVHVAGLPVSQLQQHVNDAVGRIYKNFNLDVELGQLRSIQVFVVGQARRPGSYTLSSLSTLVTAIFATGGPSVQGSLRDIQLKRNGEILTHFDLYDLLVNGDKSKDVPLLPGDVIYIPAVGAQVAVSGSVHNPAIYELKGETSVSDLIRYAGGLSVTASVLRASLERVDAHTDRTAVDISLEGAGLETALHAGDILQVAPISPKFQNTVTLHGNVADPGRFAWHPGMKLSDVIPDSKSLITRDYWERRNQLGIPGPEFRPEYARNPDFYPTNPAESRYQQAGMGQANGGALQPNGQPGQGPNGANSNSNSNSNTGDSTYLNSGPLAESDPNLNCGPTAGQYQSPDTNSSDNNGNPQNTSQRNQPCNNNLTNEGAQPQGNALSRPPLNLVLPVPEIDWSYAVIERFNPQTLTNSLIPFNLGKLILDHDLSQDLPLESGDVVTIFSQADIKVPQAQRTKFVRLEGEFKQAGIYSVSPGETLRQLVVSAGGLTPDAYLFGSELTRRSTRNIQQQRLEDYLSHLEVEIDAASAASSANSVTPQDETATQAEVAASRSLVARFRLLRATGRIVLAIPPDATGLEYIPDIPLEDGDQFTIPSRPSTVNVVGAVYNQNSFVFQRSEQTGRYLRLAGGPTQDADGKRTFVIRADGSIVSRQSENGVFGNTFASMRLDPGDTVVVPERVPKATILRDLVNYTQIFSQVALGAAAIEVLR